ncbi:hypothetical protein DTO166G4_1686 [Paecilomyces variotii]|nr:hypothetical protein DTO166G4_1686 [Paecilomyces variotii]KAJ9220927.1 hypothetical protein DTO169C6_6740 [Paecilomyces variotii]KAJ9238010.1 hypothetical protein DTO166G5_3247 [Paecilomyces variotii]KAJ9246891.1 hypothetical protein DTO207G8_8501 [Paecilomyces variotii]KAJ9252181.1 hypothetical protein DTO195F2_7553 [Paecilomyces variotii]
MSADDDILTVFAVMSKSTVVMMIDVSSPGESTAATGHQAKYLAVPPFTPPRTLLARRERASGVRADEDETEEWRRLLQKSSTTSRDGSALTSRNLQAISGDRAVNNA